MEHQRETMVAEATERDDWIGGTEASRLLGVTRNQLGKIERKGGLSVRRLPGCFPTYSRSEVLELKRTAVRKAAAK